MEFQTISAGDCGLFDLTRSIASTSRPANDAEVTHYARWLAMRAGLMTGQHCAANYETHGKGKGRWQECLGVTFGDVMKGRTLNSETRAYEPAEYREGSFSIPMPGRFAHRAKVTQERLDDDGNVIASSTLPVGKKGEILWDKKAVHEACGPVPKVKRGKVKAAPIAVAHDPAPLPAETEASPVEAPTAPCDEIGSIGPDNAEIALSAPNAPEIDGNETTTGGDDAMAAIMARLDALEARLAGDAEAAPIDAIKPPAPAVERVKRSPAHERAIRRAWAERRNARLQRDIARDHMRMREQLSEQWQQALMLEKAKRARSVERSRANYRLAKKQIAAKHELLNELFRARADHKALEKQLATAKASPTYMDADGHEFADARAMAMQRANEAVERAERIAGRLAMAEATVKRQEGAIGAMETRMMEAVGRALRAENALRAIEEREERGGQPYVMGTPIVEFRRAA